MAKSADFAGDKQKDSGVACKAKGRRATGRKAWRVACLEGR
jgi:hypothetical protein